MRLLTYNIHGWRGGDGALNLDRLLRIIEASDADIVALNEVFHPFSLPDSDRTALDILADALGMSYAFGVALTPQFAFSPLSSYGNALLSRFDILAHAGHHLTPIGGHEQRGLLEARLLLPDSPSPLSVYVTHLDHRSEAVRLRQLNSVLQWTNRDRERRHLLLGDFNALAPQDYEGRAGDLDDLRDRQETAHMVADGLQVVPHILSRGYSDAGASGEEGRQPTFPAERPVIRIDYVWVSPAMAGAIRSCGRWRTDETAIASDHLPVFADFEGWR
ncbi:MAG: endonuclease/exonuclease/phosphatase family protein [Chloroflexota bacterium]|nr:endonuclease/exonuclease/phosphatase family protein [Chloroflexota bacterium]